MSKSGMRVLIVDDEKEARDVLEILLEKSLVKTTVIGQAKNVQEAVAQIKSKKPDLVLLDIEMPEEQGLNIVQYFDEINFHVIFVTAYNQYAIQAFEVNAIDYLMKPVSRQKFNNAIVKAEKICLDKKQLREYKSLIKSFDDQQQQKHIKFNEVGTTKIIPLNDIIAIEADRTYSLVHLLHSDKPYVVSKNIGKIETLFPHKHPFFRVHKSWFVNKSHIVSYSKKSIQLKNDIEAKLSKYKKDSFQDFIGY